ncbi:hypothetical protein ACFX12_035661 [Malus domestica]
MLRFHGDTKAGSCFFWTEGKGKETIKFEADDDDTAVSRVFPPWTSLADEHCGDIKQGEVSEDKEFNRTQKVQAAKK